jgi:hypothetical protein
LDFVGGIAGLNATGPALGRACFFFLVLFYQVGYSECALILSGVSGWLGWGCGGFGWGWGVDRLFEGFIGKSNNKDKSNSKGKRRYFCRSGFAFTRAFGRVELRRVDAGTQAFGLGWYMSGFQP